MDDADLKWDEESKEQWRAYGQVGGTAIIMAAHTYRSRNGQEKVRIISARLATRYERQKYEKENG